MKKLFYLFAFMFMLSIGVNAQSSIIKTNPLGLAFGNFNATYEAVISESSSVLVSANYFYRLFGVDVNSFGAGGGYRYYITYKKKDIPSGFYVQPQVGFSFGGVGDFNYNTFSIGAELGYQWAWPSGFVLDLGIGPNYTSLGGDYQEIAFDNGSGIFPSATLAIGYAF